MCATHFDIRMKLTAIIICLKTNKLGKNLLFSINSCVFLLLNIGANDDLEIANLVFQRSNCIW